MITWLNLKFVCLDSRTYKMDILWPSSYTQDVATFCAPRVLYQVTTDLRKHVRRTLQTLQQLIDCCGVSHI